MAFNNPATRPGPTYLVHPECRKCKTWLVHIDTTCSSELAVLRRLVTSCDCVLKVSPLNPLRLLVYCYFPSGIRPTRFMNTFELWDVHSWALVFERDYYIK